MSDKKPITTDNIPAWQTDEPVVMAEPEPATAAARVAEIRRHHGDDRPCSTRNDECFLLGEVDRLSRAITRVLRLLADQEAYCGDERLDVPSWVQSVRKALNDE